MNRLHPNAFQAVQWILQQQQPAIDQLIRWSNQNSWSHDPTKLSEMAATLAEDFAKVGIEMQSVDLPKLRLLGDGDQWDRAATGPMLVWHHNEHLPKRQRVLLMIHYDTVYPPEHRPQMCELNVDTGSDSGSGTGSDSGRLIGPGVADAKGGIAVIGLAAAAMRKFGLLQDIGLSIVLNPDEEIGSSASAPLVKQLCSGFGGAFLFEPSLPDGSLVANRKGSGNFSILVRGKSAHAGRDPESGRNAIVKLAALIGQLQQSHDPDGGISINVGNIAGGGPLNQVPDFAIAKLNVRVLDHQAQAKVEDLFQQMTGKESVDGYRVTTLGEFHCPPKLAAKPIQRLQQVVENANRLAGQPVTWWQDTGGACDGSKLAAWGLPNIDTLGVRGGNLHSADEYMLPDSLAASAIRTLFSVLLATKQ